MWQRWKQFGNAMGKFAIMGMHFIVVVWRFQGWFLHLVVID